MSKKTPPFFQKVWYFIWEDDSVLSWIVNVVLAFVLIKFIVYPGIGLLFGTTHPVVAVVSGSMEHAYSPSTDFYGNYRLDSDGNLIYAFCTETYKKEKSFINLRDFKNFNEFWKICGSWYEQNNISKQEFEKFPLKNGFNTGDIIVLLGKYPGKIQVGNVIVFQGNRPDPIIHRVVEKNNKEGGFYFSTKGDHNPTSDPYKVKGNNIIGKAVLRIPLLGYIKIWFVDFLKLLGIYKYVPI
jgi:hypothetical protein